MASLWVFFGALVLLSSSATAKKPDNYQVKIIRSFTGGAESAPADRGFSRTDCEWYDQVPKDITENLAYRKYILDECRNDPKAQEEVWCACKREPLFWLNVFGYTFDPRLPHGYNDYPFITFDIQDDAIYEIYQALGYYDLLIEKSRDEGASWICMASLTHQWQFEVSQQFSVTSRKADLVDKTGNKDALFWKILYLADNQPGWLKPFYDKNEMMLNNPDQGSTIIGESATGEVGRGGRNRAMFIDEFPAFNRDDGYKVEAATGSNTDCRIFNGTPQGTGNAFFEIRQGMEEGKRAGKKIRLYWTEDPRKNMGLYINGGGYKEMYPGAPDHDRYNDHDIVMLEYSPEGRKVDEWEFAADYNFILDGKIRSPWYDVQESRYSHPMLVAQELDIDYHNSSYNFFDEKVIQTVIQTQVHPPFMVGEFKFDADGEYTGFEEDPDGGWRLWLRLDAGGYPNRRIQYAMSADVSLGTGASISTSSIGNPDTGEKLAEYANPRISPEDWGRLYGKVCTKVFHQAYAIWENNGPGRTFGPKALGEGIEKFYHRKDDPSIKHKVSDIPGWASTKERKATLLSNYRDAQHKGQFSNPSHPAVTECREYLSQPDGSVVHQAAKSSVDPTGAGSAHGDRVMADALLFKAMEELQRGVGASDDQDDGLETERPPHPGCMAYRNMLSESDGKAEDSGLWTERR